MRNIKLTFDLEVLGVDILLGKLQSRRAVLRDWYYRIWMHPRGFHRFYCRLQYSIFIHAEIKKLQH